MLALDLVDLVILAIRPRSTVSTPTFKWSILGTNCLRVIKFDHDERYIYLI